MKQLLRNALLLTSCLALTVAAEEVYKSVDEHGRVIYSEKPINDSSERVELPDSNTMPAPEVRSQDEDASTEETADDPNQPPTDYQVRITHPPEEHHITPGTFNLSVDVSTEPGLHPDHQLRITDNGDWVEGMTIENIIRGSHQIQAHVLDQQGRVISRSPIVNVYVHRPPFLGQ